jgi:hypothetical protein
MSVRTKTSLEILALTGRKTGSTVMGGTVVLPGSPPYDINSPAITGNLPLERVSGLVRTVTAGFDGGGSPLTLPVTQDVFIGSARSITSWELIADQTGAATIEVLRGTLADLIAGSPPVASITAANDPELAAEVAATDSTLPGWTKTLAAGDVLRFVLSAVDGVQTKLTLTLTTT